MEIKFPLSFLRISLLIINFVFYNSSILPVGINQLNNFIYLEKLLSYTVQTYSGKCSLKNGPNCYFTDNMRRVIYEQENNIEEEIEEDNNINNVQHKTAIKFSTINKKDLTKYFFNAIIICRGDVL